MSYYGTRHRRAMISDETEALQTDVMRFLAIICMCLMIVFSLVQSLPMGEEENKPSFTTPEMLKKEIEILKEKARQLKQSSIELERVVISKKIQMEQLTKRMVQNREQVAQLDGVQRKKVAQMVAVQERLEQIQQRIRQAMEKEQKLQSLIKKAEKSLASGKEGLSRIDTLIKKGAVVLDTITAEVREAGQALKTIDADDKPISTHEQSGSTSAQNKSKADQKFFSVSRPTRSEERSSPQKNGTESKNQKKGFTLGFESNDALFQLLQRGQKVNFYMISGKRNWQLVVKPSGRVAFLPFTASPGKVYEMNRRTVPDKIIRAGREVVASFGAGDITYGVALSPEISSEIVGLMQGNTGGDLVISSNGRVVLE